MRRRTSIKVYNPEDRSVLQELHYYFSGKGINTKYEGGILEATLYDDTPEFIILMDELNNRGLYYRQLEVREYTKKDLEQTELFHMELAFPYELDGKNQIMELIMKIVALIVI